MRGELADVMFRPSRANRVVRSENLARNTGTEIGDMSNEVGRVKSDSESLATVNPDGGPSVDHKFDRAPPAK
jgi:hypothetical protein